MSGSLVNDIYAAANQPVPVVGMGATMLQWTDRHAGTVIAVTHFKSGARKGQVKSFTVQRDKATVTSGSTHDGSAVYAYEPDPNGGTRVFTVNKQGRYRDSGQGLILGIRDEHYDPTF